MDVADRAEVERFVELGAELGGKYRIARLLGVGGMGAVVEARHLQLGEPVAIKFLLPRTVGRAHRSARFLREARAASRLKSAHVARVFDVDERADGTPYIVMEYLTGETLAARLAREEPTPVAQLVDELLEAGEAIAEAHSLGIVHRDLKPANLFLARGAGNVLAVKVLDFGILKHLGDAAAADDATTGEAPIGSPPYMSPEQLTRASEVDHRTDIWSLGVCLYEGLTGSSPFAGSSFMQTCTQVLQSRPLPVSEVRADVTSELSAVVARCLMKDPAARFASVAELARALVPFGTERARRSLSVIDAIAAPRSEPLPGGEPRPRESPSIDTGTLTAATESMGRSLANKLPYSNRTSLVVGSALAALVGIGVWLWSRRDGSGAGPDMRAVPSASLPSASRATASAADAGPTPAGSAELALLPALPRVPAPAASASGAGAPPPATRRSKLVDAGLAPPPPVSAAPPATKFDPVYEDRR
jgi:serine/threonine protein kinase